MLRGTEFIRVSTDEQAQHGYSLEAQRAALDDYARHNNVDIVDRYIDEGVSARIPYQKRPEFMRLIRDVEAGKIDCIYFIKLDRWFRNVKEYYKAQEILDAHNVNWKAIFEDYDTQIVTGRLNLNIMLSLAQNESDRTSERIKFVFQDKVRRGQSYTAALPIGYCLDEQKHIVLTRLKRSSLRATSSSTTTIMGLFTAPCYICIGNMDGCIAQPRSEICW